MLEFIKIINTEYAGVLSFLSSLIMVIVTVVYVCYTKRQADNSQESVNLLLKQIKTDKQPCILPEIVGSYGSAFDTSTYARIQAGVNITLRNVGDAPAICVYTICECELQFTKDINGRKKRLSAALLPYYIQAISAQEIKEISIHFETKEVKRIIEELKKDMDMNWERIRTNPSREHYVGAIIILTVIYKNALGQWFKSIYKRELSWLAFDNPPPQTTHNLNENTIPPKEIKSGDRFKMVFISPKYAPYEHTFISKRAALKFLSKYDER